MSLLGPTLVAPPQAGRYQVLYPDPPWPERGGGKIKRGADRHYALMSVAEILDLARTFGEWAAADAHLYCWVTNNFLPAGFDFVKTAGFRYVTLVTWVKDRPGLGQYFRGTTEHCLFAVRGRLPYRVVDGKRAQGRTSFYEPAIEARRSPFPPGRDEESYCCDCAASADEPCFDDCAKRAIVPPDLPEAFEAPAPRSADGKRIHSRKPAKMREYIERVSGDVARLEMFARIATPGYDLWGNEAPR